MNKFRAAVASMRLRTLPLSTGGVLLGILLATADFKVDVWVAALIVLTTVCLQILSNLSNELGDVLHGTDTADRKGPQYGLNGGVLTIGEMKVLIGAFVGLCILFGTMMTLRSFGTLWELTPILVLLMGAGAIMGAMKYTLGRNPYGYRGLGDVYVFLFFGLVAVMGGYFVASHTLFWRLILPGAAVGCFSVGVLNVNNIRDMERAQPRHHRHPPGRKTGEDLPDHPDRLRLDPDAGLLSTADVLLVALPLRGHPAAVRPAPSRRLATHWQSPRPDAAPPGDLHLPPLPPRRYRLLRASVVAVLRAYLPVTNPIFGRLSI